jgi:nucleolar protein 9
VIGSGRQPTLISRYVHHGYPGLTECTPNNLRCVQEKIGKNLIPHEQFLAASYYGKFFARNLNLYLLKRDPEEWKNLQLSLAKGRQARNIPPMKTDPEHGSELEEIRTGPSSEHVGKRERRKRKRGTGDEIDTLFETALSGKKHKGADQSHGDATLASVDSPAGRSVDRNRESKHGSNAQGDRLVEDRELSAVLGAIRTAPKERKSGKAKRAKP